MTLVFRISIFFLCSTSFMHGMVVKPVGQLTEGLKNLADLVDGKTKNIMVRDTIINLDDYLQKMQGIDIGGELEKAESDEISQIKQHIQTINQYNDPSDCNKKFSGLKQLHMPKIGYECIPFAGVLVVGSATYFFAQGIGHENFAKFNEKVRADMGGNPFRLASRKRLLGFYMAYYLGDFINQYPKVFLGLSALLLIQPAMALWNYKKEMNSLQKKIYVADKINSTKYGEKQEPITTFISEQLNTLKTNKNY